MSASWFAQHAQQRRSGSCNTNRGDRNSARNTSALNWFRSRGLVKFKGVTWQGGKTITSNGECRTMKFSARNQSKISRDVSAETNTPIALDHSLALGDRVRMSAWGRTRHPKYGDRRGFIVGRGSPSSWRVKFDGRRCIQTIHQEYLEKAP